MLCAEVSALFVVTVLMVSDAVPSATCVEVDACDKPVDRFNVDNIDRVLCACVVSAKVR